MDITFFEVFKEEEIEIKKNLPKHINAEFNSQTIQDSRLKDIPSSLISIRTQSHIPMQWASKLKGILSRSQGYDHLLSYREKIQSHIPSGYLPPYCSNAVAEQAILSMMSLLRKFKKQIKSFETFYRDELTGLECCNQSVLVIGVGHIGNKIIDISKGLSMNVKGVDIDPKKEGLEYVSLKEGVAWADIIFCSLPLTNKTNHMLNYDLLKNAGKNKFLINISRGEITPMYDLNKLLNEGVLSAIALDVFPHEKELADCLRGTSKQKTGDLDLILKLSKQDNVIFTPHNAFNSQEALANKARLSVEAIIYFLENNAFPIMI